MILFVVAFQYVFAVARFDPIKVTKNPKKTN